MCRRKKKPIKPEDEITYSAAMAKIEPTRPRMRFSTMLYMWLAIILSLLALFMFWIERKNQFSTTDLVIIITSICMAVFFAIIVFVRFIRSRSITGGLFLTTCISTGVFLGTSQLIPIIIPPTAAAFSASPDVTNNGLSMIITLAQIGLFAIWFVFLLFTIYLYVQPVKRIDKYLGKIVEGEKIKKVKIGAARQYKSIEEKLLRLARKDSYTPPESSQSLQEADGTSTD